MRRRGVSILGGGLFFGKVYLIKKFTYSYINYIRIGMRGIMILIASGNFFWFWVSVSIHRYSFKKKQKEKEKKME